MLELNLKLEGVHQTREVLDSTGARLRKFKPLFEKISEVIAEDIEENFEGKGRRYGKWPKRKRPGGHDLLEKSGLMRRSFKHKITNRRLRVTNTTDYFKYHQSSEPRKSNLPRRIMMDLDRVLIDKILVVTGKWVTSVIRAKGSGKVGSGSFGRLTRR